MTNAKYEGEAGAKKAAKGSSKGTGKAKKG